MGITIVNHPFGNGLYQLSMVMTGGWFIIVMPTLVQFCHRCQMNKNGTWDFVMASTHAMLIASANFLFSEECRDAKKNTPKIMCVLGVFQHVQSANWGAVLYFTGLLWSFMGSWLISLSCLPLEQTCVGSGEHDSSWVNQGVGIVSDIFMGAIEKAKSLICNFCANWILVVLIGALEPDSTW